MKSIFYLCVQDFKRLLTHALFWILTVMLAVIVLVVDLALPKEVAQESYRVVTYNMPVEIPETEAAESADALRDAVKQGDAIGLLYEDGGITIVHPGYSEKTLNALMLELSGVPAAEVETELLDPDAKTIPFNLRSTPIFICFEAIMVGFILGGALMLAEKQDGTVRALRTAPLGGMKYVLSKTLLFSLLGTLYSLLICVMTVGFSINWGIFLLLTFFGTAVFTMIGLAFTTPFRDMSGWFFSMALLLSVNMLPVISISSPAFSPFWMKLIPSYPVLMALQSAMFGGNIDTAYTLGAVAAWLLLSGVAAYWSVEKVLLKEARA